MENTAFESEQQVTPLAENGGPSEKGSPPPEKAAASGGNGIKVTLEMNRDDKPLPLKPYPGMGKEDLLRFSQTPFWNRLRFACLIVFWSAWLALLVAVVVLTIVLPRCSAPPARDWWQHTVVYDVHVPSFYDSDGDGTGDIKGVHEKIDFIQSLGVDTIALSPIYKSDTNPETGDLGYDVIDHQAVDVRVGLMVDLKALVQEAHKRGMKIMLDFIPNHTSKKHTWFQESRKNASITNPYWNYYIWADCTENVPPNNWLSIYGNSSWTWDPDRGQCYFHNFLTQQPELNLRSDSVLEKLDVTLRFWLTEVNVDGFRVRSASFLFEDGDLRSEPLVDGCTDVSNYNCLDHTYTRYQKENEIQVSRWRELFDELSKDTYRILAVESSDPVNETIAFYGGTLLDAAHLPINAQLTALDAQQCNGQCIRAKVDDWLNTMPSGATPNWQSANAELGRLSSLGNSSLQSLLTMLKMTLPGAVFTYYGEELGMVNGNLSLTSVDPIGKLNISLSRDRFRTPMQWTDGFNAGFTNASNPRIPLNSDYETVNVKVQDQSEGSPLSLFRKLAKLHMDEGSMKFGELYYVVNNENIVSYVRAFNGNDRFLIAINFGETESTDDYNAGNSLVPGSAEVVLATPGSLTASGDQLSLTNLKLAPHQGIIVKWPYVR